MSLESLAERRYQNQKSQPGSVQERAWAAFQAQGLPSRTTETWKYSQLTSVAKKEWVEPTRGAPLSEQALAWKEKLKAQFDVIVVQNGELRLEESVRGKDVNIVALTQSKTDLFFEDGFSGLYTALSQGGLSLKIPAGIRLERPIAIVYAQTGAQAWSTGFHSIEIGERAEVEIAEVFVGPSEAYLRTEMTHVSVGARAHVNWLRLQAEDLLSSHVSEVQAHLQEGAVFHQLQINSGAAWSRTTLRADIHGRDAEAHVSGLTFARMQQHVDQRVLVSHHQGHNSSSQLFKGVLKDRARGVLNGKIYIAQDAQKVASNQLNHNLLLSPGAEADTKPELEIYADDVKANHGASVGRMDQDKIFYFLSRAIPLEQAQQMLAQAFVVDVLMKLPSKALRELAQDQVSRVLPDFAYEMEHDV